MKRVAVIMGGTSRERKVSLDSGRAVVEALREAGHDVVPVVLEADRMDLPEGTTSVFVALHGGYGENGGAQADLDRMGVPYTGPGAAACRKAMDKVVTKRILLAAGIPTPEYDLLTPDRQTTTMSLPLVVKPPREGSSVGVFKVTKPEQWEQALQEVRALDSLGEALVETFIPGREWTVGILDGEALPVLEVLAPGGFYGFEEKYTPGVSSYCFPDGPEDADVAARCQRLAREAFQVLGCRGISRVDFRVTTDGRPFVLEVNAIPGFTATSLLPKAAARAGLSFTQLCERALASAARD